MSIMVWEAFWEGERSELNKMKRDSLTKKNEYLMKFYVKILNNNLLKIWISNLIFMHNNVSIHNADAVKLWLEEHDISLIKWLFYSSDLNPIEHLWFYLKKMVYKVCLNIEQVCNDDEKVQMILFEVLKEA
jgi:transposase